MKPVIECRNVWKIYNENRPNEVRALQDVSFEIKKNDFVAIIGPSGCGKSTLLNLIGALDKPTKGSVFIDGQDIAVLGKNRLADIRKRKIGFVFQSFNLIPVFTALENVELPTMFGKEWRNAGKKARALLAEIGLGGRTEHMPNELSIGQAQRVAIARALINNPEIIIADEPTGNLDTETSREIIGIFSKLNKQGKTIVMVTHDPNIAMVGYRIIHMKDGRILHF